MDGWQDPIQLHASTIVGRPLLLQRRAAASPLHLTPCRMPLAGQYAAAVNRAVPDDFEVELLVAHVNPVSLRASTSSMPAPISDW